MIPFFVADRPMSLNIIKSFFVNHPGVKFGLMSHALVSESFRNLYAHFPCDPSGCWLGTRTSIQSCDNPLGAERLRESVIKAVDYGIFANHPSMPYPKLFDIYEAMGANLGIMKDVFGDARRTWESAKRAVESYARKPRTFKLVLVAQGSSVDDYLWSMDRLAQFSGVELAIGGLLTRKVNSARYSSAGRIAHLDEVLSALRKAHPSRELFVLGCYHPKRHRLFAARSVFASDYKGWIFNYEHRIDRLDNLHFELSELEAQHGTSQELARAARQRTYLGRQAAAARKAYATTKNENAQKSRAKAKHRAQLSKMLRRISILDTQLLHTRSVEANGKLPSSYYDYLLAFRNTLNQTEQEVRIAGVHQYLASEVLPLMVSKS